MNEQERRRLQSELASERAALLAVVSGVGGSALSLPTRNPDWTVRDVLAHVLASDADLIALIEAARTATGPLRMPGLEQHQREIARWAAATPQSFCQELRERGDRWRGLLRALPCQAWALPVLGDWWPEDAASGTASATPADGGGKRALAEVVADWRGHDSQHAEDVRQALARGA